MINENGDVQMKVKNFGAIVMLFAGLFGFTATANAAGDRPYVGVQYATTTFESNIGNYDVGMVVGRFGLPVMKNVSVEARFGTGTGDDSISGTVSGVSFNSSFEIDQLFGVYATGHLPVGKAFKLYGFAGLTQTDFTVTVDFPAFPALNSATSVSDTSVSYGAGVDINMGKMALNLEYAAYYVDSEDSIGSVSAGITYTF